MVASINIGTIDNYPSGSNPLVPFEVLFMMLPVQVAPLVLPSIRFDVTPASFGWVNFTLASPITVTQRQLLPGHDPGRQCSGCSRYCR